jgi:hypothetical protein
MKFPMNWQQKYQRIREVGDLNTWKAAMICGRDCKSNGISGEFLQLKFDLVHWKMKFEELL